MPDDFCSTHMKFWFGWDKILHLFENGKTVNFPQFNYCSQGQSLEHISCNYSCPSWFPGLLIPEFLNSRLNFTKFWWNSLLLLFSRLIPEFPNFLIPDAFQLEPINRELGGTTVPIYCLMNQVNIPIWKLYYNSVWFTKESIDLKLYEIFKITELRRLI